MQEPSEVEQSPASSPTANVQLLATLESVSEDASHSANQANLRKGKRFFESRGALKPWNADNHFRLKKQRASWAVMITAYLCLRVPVPGEEHHRAVAAKLGLPSSVSVQDMQKRWSQIREFLQAELDETAEETGADVPRSSDHASGAQQPAGQGEHHGRGGSLWKGKRLEDMLEIFGTNPIAREHAGGAAGILEQLRAKGHDVSDLDVGKVKNFFSNQRTRVQRQPQSATGSENDADDADQHDVDSPEPAAKRSKAAQYHVFYNHKEQLIDHARRVEKAHPGMTFLIFVASPHEGHKMHIAAGGAAFLEQENFQQISTKLRHHFKRGKELLADMIRQGQHVTAPKGSANINNWYITFLGQCRHFIADLHFAEFQSRESRAVYRTAGSIWQALGTDQVLWGPGGGEGASDADRMYEDMHAPDTAAAIDGGASSSHPAEGLLSDFVEFEDGTIRYEGLSRRLQSIVREAFNRSLGRGPPTDHQARHDTPTHGGMEQPECISQLLNTGNPGLQGAAQPAWPTVRPADVRNGSTAQLATADLGNSNPAGANAEPVIPAATSRGLQTQLPEIPFQPQPQEVPVQRLYPAPATQPSLPDHHLPAASRPRLHLRRIPALANKPALRVPKPASPAVATPQPSHPSPDLEQPSPAVQPRAHNPSQSERSQLLPSCTDCSTGSEALLAVAASPSPLMSAVSPNQAHPAPLAEPSSTPCWTAAAGWNPPSLPDDVSMGHALLQDFGFEVEGLEDFIDPSTGLLLPALHLAQKLSDPHFLPEWEVDLAPGNSLQKQHLLALQGLTGGPDAHVGGRVLAWLLGHVTDEAHRSNLGPATLQHFVWFDPDAFSSMASVPDEDLSVELERQFQYIRNTQGELLAFLGRGMEQLEPFDVPHMVLLIQHPQLLEWSVGFIDLRLREIELVDRNIDREWHAACLKGLLRLVNSSVFQHGLASSRIQPSRSGPWQTDTTRYLQLLRVSDSGVWALLIAASKLKHSHQKQPFSDAGALRPARVFHMRQLLLACIAQAHEMEVISASLGR